MIESEKSQGIQSQDWRWLITFAFALLVFWTGLWRCIEVKEFKPNAFYFCLVTGLMAVGAGFLFWQGKHNLGMVIGVASAGFVFGYYLFTFVTEPEKDASYRVGIAIIAALAELIAILLPRRDTRS